MKVVFGANLGAPRAEMEGGGGTLVADVGSYSVRIGYAGGDLPQVYSSSAVGCRQGGKEAAPYDFDLGHYRDGTSVHHPVREGLISNWDAYAALWEHAARDSLKVDLRETPMLIAEKPYVPAADRIKYVFLSLVLCCAVLCCAVLRASHQILTSVPPPPPHPTPPPIHTHTHQTDRTHV